jgi:hybrid cluster-associated redox disulfide protein
MSVVDSTYPQITDDCLVHDVIERHPQTIVVFARHGMQCVGCYIAPFHTITDCAREHATAIGPLLGDLNRIIAAEPV